MKRLRDLLNPSLEISTILKPVPVAKPVRVVEKVVEEETTKKEIEENN